MSETKSTSSKVSGDVSPDIAKGDSEGQPADPAVIETRDINTANEQAAIEENQKRLDKSAGETEVTVEDAAKAAKAK